VTFSLVRHGSVVEGQFVLPAHAHARLRLRLPAGERLLRVLIGSIPVAANRVGTIDLGDRKGSITVHATVGS
jgi:hypothetical protein